MALTSGIRLHQYLYSWLIRAQSQKEVHVSTQTMVDLTQSLGWIINQEKSKLKPTQVFLFVDYEYHLDSDLVKPTQERWLKLQDLILRLKSKHVLTARCLMSLIELLASMEKMILVGHLHMAPLVLSQGALEIFSVAGQPLSLVRDHFRSPKVVEKSHKCDERCRPSSQRPQYPNLTDASNEGWGTHLEQVSTMCLLSDREKRLHINVLELNAISLALQRFKDQCQKQTVLVAVDNSTVVAYM